MPDPKNQNNIPRKRSARKWLVIIPLLILIIVIALILAIPAWLSSTSGRNLIARKAGTALDAAIEIEKLKIGWLSGAQITGLSFQDNAHTQSIKCRQITTQISLLSLLTKKLSLGKIEIDQPTVNIDIPYNESEKDERSIPAPDKKNEKPFMFPVESLDLTVSQGSLTVNMKTPQNKLQTVELQGINSHITVADYACQSQYDLSVIVAHRQTKAPVRIKGSLNQPTPGELSLDSIQTELNARIGNLHLESIRPLIALAGNKSQPTGILNGAIELNIQQGRLDKLIAQLDLQNFSNIYEDKKFELSQPVKADINLDNDDGRILIEKLNIESSFCKLNCTGTKDVIDYSLTSNIDETSAFLSQFMNMGQWSATGNLTSSGKIVFEKQKISSAGQSHVKDLILKNEISPTPLTTADISYDLNYDIENKTLTIASADIAGPPASVKLTASTIPFTTTPDKVLTLNMEFKGDMEKIHPYLAMIKGFPKDLTLAGNLHSDLSLSRKDDKWNIDTSDTTIEKFIYSKSDKEPFSGDHIDFALNAFFDPATKTVAVNNLKGKYTKTESTLIVKNGQFTGTNKDARRFNGNFEIEANADTVNTFASEYIPEDFNLTGKCNAAIELAGKLPESDTEDILSTLTAKTTLGFETADYKGLNFDSTSIVLELKNKILNIDLPRASVNNGTLTFAGAIDLDEKPMVLRLSKPIHLAENIRINETIGRELLMYLNPIFADQGSVTGIADFQCQKLNIPLEKDSKDKIVVDGTIKIDDINMQAKGLIAQILSRTNNKPNLQAALLPTHFILENNVLRYLEEMQVNLDVYPTSFNGIINLNKNMNMRVKLPYRINTEKFGLESVKLGEDLSNRIELPLEGPVDNPNIRLDKVVEDLGKKLLEQELQRRLDSEIQKGIERLFK